MTMDDKKTMRELAQKLLEEMRKEVGKTIRKIESCRDMTGEGMKGIMRNGMENMIKVVEGVFLGMSEGLDEARKEGKEKEENLKEKLVEVERLSKVNEEKIEELDRKIREVEERQEIDKEASDKVGEAMLRGRKFCRWRESVRTMEGQVEDAACKIKVVGIKLDNETEDKKQIVRMALDRMSKDVKKESQRKFEGAMKRTKLVVLGKGTTKVKMEDEWIATVPILLCCQSKGEKEEIERCLREAGYTTLFYWPDSVVDFVRGAREEVRKNGFDERTYQVRIRPDRRDGKVVIRADIRRKEERRFRPEVYWRIPGERKLADQLGLDVYTPLGTRHFSG
jgi:hypothetical protein